MLQITDWDTFHDAFAATLGFPGFYGRNMDAWIDCVTSVDRDDGMTAVRSSAHLSVDTAPARRVGQAIHIRRREAG